MKNRKTTSTTKSRFKQAEAPDYCSPSETHDVEERKEIVEENTLRDITQEPEYDPKGVCSTNEPSTVPNPNPDPIVLSLDEISALCKDFFNPQMVSGVLLQLLVQHFSSSSNFFIEEISNLVWSSDVRKNKIRLTTSDRWDPAKGGQVPSVVLKRMPMQFTRMVIGDKDVHDVHKNKPELFTRAVAGSHRFLCIGATPAESELLASEVAQYLTVFSPVFRRRLPFFDFQVGQLSPIQQFEDLANKSGVAVTVSYQYVWTWAVQEQGALMKSVTVDTQDAQGASAGGDGGTEPGTNDLTIGGTGITINGQDITFGQVTGTNDLTIGGTGITINGQDITFGDSPQEFTISEETVTISGQEVLIG